MLTHNRLKKTTTSQTPYSTLGNDTGGGRKARWEKGSPVGMDEVEANGRQE